MAVYLTRTDAARSRNHTMPLAPHILAAIDGAAVALALVCAAVAAVVAALVGIRRGRAQAEQSATSRANEEARRVIEGATARAKETELAAERAASERRAAVDREVATALAGMQESQERAQRIQDTLERKLELIAERETRLDAQEQALTARAKEIEDRIASLERDRTALRDRLSQISGLSPEQARALVLQDARERSELEAAALEQKLIAEAESRAADKAREVTLQAIQRYAGQTAADSIVRTVKIPSDDMKGRLIGREGRNIRAIEKATGVDIIIDDTPGVIAVSCFDRVRQTIAVEALQKLVSDGRVHPSRVEEAVEHARREVQDRINTLGTEAVVEANVQGLHPKVIETMGRLGFRTSYGQNVLRHSIEVAYLCQLIADQLGLNGAIARRAGFLHDIGKAMDHEVQGGHAIIGMDFLKQYGERSEAVLNAVGGHHLDIPTTTPYTPIVMAADAISGARPGARRESMEMYIKRLRQLEDIAKAQPHVTEAYAIQAGREVRVIVDAAKADDAHAHLIAKRIAEQVQAEMTFPGEIKVTVLREVRAEATAR
jgi:ribonuclease Y